MMAPGRNVAHGLYPRTCRRQFRASFPWPPGRARPIRRPRRVYPSRRLFRPCRLLEPTGQTFPKGLSHIRFAVRLTPGMNASPGWLAQATRGLGLELEARMGLRADPMSRDHTRTEIDAVPASEPGTLVVELGPVALPTLIACLQDWLQARKPNEILKIAIRHGRKSVELEHHRATRLDVEVVAMKLLAAMLD